MDAVQLNAEQDHQKHYAEAVALHNVRQHTHQVHAVEVAYAEHEKHLHVHGLVKPGLSPETLNRIAKLGFLRPDDGVAISFWIISIAMVASTVFFISEGNHIAANWRTSLNVGALVTLIAAVHYFYMREYWIKLHNSPIVYRYIDWSLTVPLQMVEFFLILSAVKPDLGTGMFWRLLLGTVAMLAFGYLGEEQLVNPWLGFAAGMAGWGYILMEIFQGEAANIAGKDVGPYVQSAFKTCRFIVTVGWCIYPAGYFFGYLLNGIDDATTNLIYNLADFVNKIAFCLCIWAAAKAETKARGQA